MDAYRINESRIKYLTNLTDALIDWINFVNYDNTPLRSKLRRDTTIWIFLRINWTREPYSARFPKLRDLVAMGYLISQQISTIIETREWRKIINLYRLLSFYKNNATFPYSRNEVITDTVAEIPQSFAMIQSICCTNISTDTSSTRRRHSSYMSRNWTWLFIYFPKIFHTFFEKKQKAFLFSTDDLRF